MPVSGTSNARLVLTVALGCALLSFYGCNENSNPNEPTQSSDTTNNQGNYPSESDYQASQAALDAYFSQIYDTTLLTYDDNLRTLKFDLARAGLSCSSIHADKQVTLARDTAKAFFSEIARYTLLYIADGHPVDKGRALASMESYRYSLDAYVLDSISVCTTFPSDYLARVSLAIQEQFDLVAAFIKL